MSVPIILTRGGGVPVSGFAPGAGKRGTWAGAPGAWARAGGPRAGDGAAGKARAMVQGEGTAGRGPRSGKVWPVSWWRSRVGRQGARQIPAGGGWLPHGRGSYCSNLAPNQIVSPPSGFTLVLGAGRWRSTGQGLDFKVIFRTLVIAELSLNFNGVSQYS